MKPTKSTLSLIIDTIFATWIVALVVATALRSIASLITEPDRPLLPIMLDWLIIVVFVIAVIVTALLARRVLANAKAEEAAEQAREKARVDLAELHEAGAQETLRRLANDTHTRNY